MSKQPYTTEKIRQFVDTIKLNTTNFQSGATNKISNEVVLVLGGTKSGKSTIMNILSGQTMDVFRRDDDPDGDWLIDVSKARDSEGNVIIGPTGNPIQNYAGEIKAAGFEPIRIGHSGDSTTTFPNYINVTPELQFWDCPGFGDTREPDIEISNMYFIHHILKQVLASNNKAIGDASSARNKIGGIKFVIVQSADGLTDRGVGFKNSINTICKLFLSKPPAHVNQLTPEEQSIWYQETMVALIDASTFVFTKIEDRVVNPTQYLTNVLKRINPKHTIKTNDLEDQLYRKFLDYMTEMHAQDNTRIQHAEILSVEDNFQLTMLEETRSQILTKVSSTTAVHNFEPRLVIDDKTNCVAEKLKEVCKQEYSNKCRELEMNFADIFTKMDFVAVQQVIQDMRAASQSYRLQESSAISSPNDSKLTTLFSKELLRFFKTLETKGFSTDLPLIKIKELAADLEANLAWTESQNIIPNPNLTIQKQYLQELQAQVNSTALFENVTQALKPKHSYSSASDMSDYHLKQILTKVRGYESFGGKTNLMPGSYIKLLSEIEESIELLEFCDSMTGASLGVDFTALFSAALNAAKTYIDDAVFIELDSFSSACKAYTNEQEEKYLAAKIIAPPFLLIGGILAMLAPSQSKFAIEKWKEGVGYIYGARSNPGEKPDHSQYNDIKDAMSSVKQDVPARFLPKAPKPTDNTWYDSLAISDSLVKRGFSKDTILEVVEDNKGLKVRLQKTDFAPNAYYVIPLHVNALDGTFTAKNHWVSLYITTDMTGKIAKMNYVNPMGNPIDIYHLSSAIEKHTGVRPVDITRGKGIQYVYLEESILAGNVSDCGPMLVQLLYELKTHGKIITTISSLHQSVTLGQKLRQEQKQELLTHANLDSKISATDTHPISDIIQQGSDVVNCTGLDNCAKLHDE